MDLITELRSSLYSTTMGILPIMLFLLIFYVAVLRQELLNRGEIIAGVVLVVLGLSLLLLGLDEALLPVGRLMVEQLTAGVAGPEASSPGWAGHLQVYAFGFCAAFGTAVAEPALRAVSIKVNEMSGGAIRAGGLRVVAALGVASGVVLGCVRIVADIPLHWCVGALALVITLQGLLVPRWIVPLAYDTGGVSTTAVTVPVLAALGLGLAEQLPGRDPLLDGFGLIVLACLFPAVTVLAYAQTAWVLDRILSRRNGAAAARDRAGEGV